MNRQRDFEIGRNADLALAIEAQEKRREELGIAKDDVIGCRKMDVPAGIKKVYAVQPKSGKREAARRLKQMVREKKHEAQDPQP